LKELKREKFNRILKKRLKSDLLLKNNFDNNELLKDFQDTMNKKLETMNDFKDRLIPKKYEINGIRIPTRGKSSLKYSNQELMMVNETKNSLNNFLADMYPSIFPSKKIKQ
jgi:hypothetical protein